MSKTVEAGDIVIFPRWEVNIESDGFEDWLCFEDVYVHGELVPAEDSGECTVLKMGESAYILDEHLGGYCRVVNENGKPVFYDNNGAKIFDAILDEEGHRMYDDAGYRIDYTMPHSN